MRTESTDLITCYCWDKNPAGPGRCILEPGHDGDHRDWYARSSWSEPGTRWPRDDAH